MKRNTGVITLFSILLLVSLGYGIYTSVMFSKADSLYKDMAFKYKKVSANSSYITIADVSSRAYNYVYNLYAYNYPAEVVGHKGELYQIEGTAESLKNCVDDLVGTNKVMFKDDIYKCEAQYSSPSTEIDPVIKKLNIKEKDIKKVVIADHPGKISNKEYVTFFIFESGEVKYSINNDKLKTLEELNNYKIKDITHFYCKFGSYDTCKGGYKMTAVTKSEDNVVIDLNETLF